MCVCLCVGQAFPPVPEERKPNSRLQERLLKKLGQHAHPFYFTVSDGSPKAPAAAQAGSDFLFLSECRRLTQRQEQEDAVYI